MLRSYSVGMRKAKSICISLFTSYKQVHLARNERSTQSMILKAMLNALDEGENIRRTRTKTINTLQKTERKPEHE